MRGTIGLVLLVVTSCISAGATVCADGRVCPQGTVCDEVHTLCVTHAQTTACAGLSEGDRCDADGRLGICDQAYCISGCGDSVQDGGEECDDGNAASHDGCSSSCLLEVPSWQPLPPQWRGRSNHVAAYDGLRHKLVVQGGSAATGYDAATWERDASGWTRGPDGPLVSGAVMAFDGTRMIFFGGRNPDGTGSDRTWAFTGQWTELFPATKPPPLVNATMVYDANRGRMVLFGGSDASFTVVSAETWEFTGTTWVKATPTMSPGARREASIAWDASRQRVVLFGGAGLGLYPSETWEYDGTSWSLRSPTSLPPARYLAVMAYDPARARVVLFGGLLSGGVQANDTWEYNGTSWLQRSVTVTPPARTSASLTYDPDVGRTVLVGGSDIATNGARSDVWEYSGTDWQPASGEPSPGPRNAIATFDSARREVVLFGGQTSSVGSHGDTWIFDGVRWSKVSAAGPTPRHGHALAFDPARQRTLLFGGRDELGMFGDTWEWDGITWLPITSSPQPPPRVFAALAHDESAQRSVMFGGCADYFCNQLLADTWIFDGAWHEITTPPELVARRGAMMAYDPRVQRVVLFGGKSTTIAMNDTWELDGTTWTRLVTAESPQPRNTAGMVYDAMRGRVFLYGGAMLPVGDAWELVRRPVDQGGDTWVHVTVPGQSPRPLQSFALACHVDRRVDKRAIMLFGGADAGGQLGETWLYRWQSTTPDEDCSNGVDDDEDRRIDCSDPDCICP